MFKQSAEKFAAMVQSMKQMASEMHNELEATRNELRRGVLEMPQEAADNTAQMRKVIVDQIEALAELNRIVAHHGRGLDVMTTSRASVQREEDLMAIAGGRDGTLRMRDPAARRHLPPPDLGMPAPRRTEAPPVSPASSRPGSRRLAVRPAQPHRCADDGSRGPAAPRAPQTARPIRWNRCRSTSAG